MEVDGQLHATAAWMPRKSPGTHCKVEWFWLGTSQGKTQRKISAPLGNRTPIPQSSSPYQNYILAKLSYNLIICVEKNRTRYAPIYASFIYTNFNECELSFRIISVHQPNSNTRELSSIMAGLPHLVRCFHCKACLNIFAAMCLQKKHLVYTSFSHFDGQCYSNDRLLASYTV